MPALAGKSSDASHYYHISRWEDGSYVIILASEFSQYYIYRRNEETLCMCKAIDFYVGGARGEEDALCIYRAHNIFMVRQIA